MTIAPKTPIADKAFTDLNRNQLKSLLGWAKRRGLTEIKLTASLADMQTEWGKIQQLNSHLVLVGYWTDSNIFIVEWAEEEFYIPAIVDDFTDDITLYHEFMQWMKRRSTRDRKV